AEIAAELSSYLADLDEAGPRELDAVETRRALLGALARRHGGTLDDLLALAETGAARLAELEGDDDRIAELEEERAVAASELDNAATALTASRTAAAARLATRVTA